MGPGCYRETGRKRFPRICLSMILLVRMFNEMGHKQDSIVLERSGLDVGHGKSRRNHGQTLCQFILTG